MHLIASPIPSFVVPPVPSSLPLPAHRRLARPGRLSLRHWHPSILRDTVESGVRSTDESVTTAAQPQAEDEITTKKIEESGRPPSPSPWPAINRKLMAFVGGVGLVETAFLTYTKLFASVASICPTGGCYTVLGGPYSTVFGIPLTAPAMLAYGLVTYLSLLPLSKPSAEQWTRPMLLALTTAMATFSVYLMSVLVFQLQEFCPYCYLSAGLSLTLFLMSWLWSIVPDGLQSRIIRYATAVVMAVMSLGVYSVQEPGNLAAVVAFVRNPVASLAGSEGEEGYEAGWFLDRLFESEGPFVPPEITTASSARSLRLAKKLQTMGARMYGAYWCPHCYDQKQTFGKEAFEGYIEYVECAREGLNSERDRCDKRDVPGYPTWEINGELYPGEKSLATLEKIAGIAPPDGTSSTAGSVKEDLSPVANDVDGDINLRQDRERVALREGWGGSDKWRYTDDVIVPLKEGRG